MTKLLIRSCEGLKESQELYLSSGSLLTRGKDLHFQYYVLWILLIAA